MSNENSESPSQASQTPESPPDGIDEQVRSWLESTVGTPENASALGQLGGLVITRDPDPSGPGCLGAVVLVMILGLAVGYFLFLAPWSRSPDTTGGSPNPAVAGPQSSGPLIGSSDAEPAQRPPSSGNDDDLASDRVDPVTGSEDPAGQSLVPITGDWVVSSQDGAFGCDSEVELGGDSAVAFIEVSPSGEQITVTDYDDGSPITLDLIDASPDHATYYKDLTGIVGFQFEMSMTFDSPTTVGGRYEGCPDRVGLGYLLEARDTPGGGGIVAGPTLGVEASCEQQLAAIDASLRTDAAAVIERPDLDELQACLTPYNGLIIVEGLPDLSGVWYTASQFGRSWGADQVITLGTCAVAADGSPFQTDITVESTQVWVGLQDPNEAGDTDNAQVGALRLSENGPPSHNYVPLAHRQEGTIDVRAKAIPGENPWGGWAVMTTTFFNEADFFPYTSTPFEGEPTYGATLTLVCG